jgi:hypothetical protein
LTANFARRFSVFKFIEYFFFMHDQGVDFLISLMVWRLPNRLRSDKKIEESKDVTEERGLLSHFDPRLSEQNQTLNEAEEDHRLSVIDRCTKMTDHGVYTAVEMRIRSII